MQQGLELTPEANGAGLTAADLGREFRLAVEEKVPEVGPINERLSKVIPAKQAAGWKQAVRERQELVPLKAFVAVAADLAASKGAAVGLLALNTLWKSGRVSQAMYNLGSKLIKAGSVAEKAKIEKVMENAVTKGLIQPEEFKAVTQSIPEPEPLKFGEPTTQPEQSPDLAGWDALDPRKQPLQPRTGTGSLEDMAPPEMAQGRQQAAQASREAFIRQGRERALDIPGKPFEPGQGPQLKVMPRPIKKPPTQKELFGPSDMQYRRAKMYEYLQKTTGKDPFMKDVYSELEKLGKKDVPKAPIKETAKRAYNGRTLDRDHKAMEDLLSNGGQGIETMTVKAEDAPKTFTLGGVEFTKGRTLYGKTVFKGIRDRKFMVSSDGLIHMDKPLDEVPF
jgi:hypothetical protein